MDKDQPFNDLHAPLYVKYEMWKCKKGRKT